jgi:hypothetical protein
MTETCRSPLSAEKFSDGDGRPGAQNHSPSLLSMESMLNISHYPEMTEFYTASDRDS